MPGDLEKLRVGIVIPSYREEANIVALLEGLLVQLPAARIVVVDDSPDSLTVEAVRRFGHAQVTWIHREKKDGRGSAVLAGIARLLEGDVERVVELDADSSHQTSELRDLLAESVKGEWDLMIASRYTAESRIVNWPASRRAFSKCANLLARALLQVPITDYTNGYRVYSRRAAELIVRECGRIGKGFISLSEILVQLYCRGYSISERPSVFVNRIRGESSVNFEEIRNAAVGLVKIVGLRRRLRSEVRVR